MDALGLFDLLEPYFLGGVDLGPALHTLLSTVQVDDYDACYDDFGATIWGMARLDEVQTDPHFSVGSGGVSFGGTASTTNQPFPAGGIWDWNDVTFQFRIRIPRTPSVTITTAVTTVAATPPLLAKQATFTTLFNAWGYNTKSIPANTGTPAAVVPSDFPDTQFELDLLLTSATIHLPFLTGAALGGDGMLIADPKQTDVRFVLPKILLTLTQGATLGGVRLVLDSWGAQTIDDPNDRSEAQLFQMIPPLALLKGSSSFGFGFDRAILDLSDSHTPPELLAKFGIGTDWQGVYFPDLRVFFAPHGQTGFALDIDAHDLLIGIGDSSGVSGDFEIDVINQDSNPYMRAVFYDSGGNTIAADCSTSRGSEFTIALPKDFTCAIEVHSAVPPYQIILNGADITAASGFVNHSLTSPIDYSIVAKAPNTPADPHTGADNTQATLLLHVVPQVMSQAPAVILTPSKLPLTLSPGPPQDGIHSIELIDAKAGRLRFSPGPPTAVQVTVTNESNATVFSQTLSSTDTITQVPPAGKSWKVTATWPAMGGVPAPVEVEAWFHFNRPPKPEMPQALPAGIVVQRITPGTPPAPFGVPNASDIADGALKHGNIEIGTSKDEGNTGNFPEAFVSSAEFIAFVAQIPAGTTTAIDIHGFSSYEHHDPMQQFNLDLSERRATALAELIFNEAKARTPTAALDFTTTPRGNDTDDPLLPGGVSAKTAWGPDSTPASSYDPSDYWMADAKFAKAGAGTPTATITATLTTPPPGSIVVPGPMTIQPTNSRNKSRPDWFRYAKLLVRIQQNQVIAVELSGEIKFDTAANDLLQQQAQDASLKGHGDPNLSAKNLPGNSNPADGTTDFDFILSHDDSTGTWAGQLTIAAAKNDKDGLLRFGQAPADDKTPPDNGVFFNFFGSAIVFAPLIDAAEKSVTNKGTLVQVGVDAAAVAAVGLIAASNVLRTETITLYGGTLSFSEGDADISSALMFDVEVDLYIDLLGLVKTRPTKPVKVRYKSVGVKVTSNDTVGHVLLPIYFDPAKGYDIDVTDPGTFHLPGGLDDIVQVLGARIARTNPLNLELDIAMKDDFGVVSIDRAKVRWPIREFGPPQLTALGASIDIPGAFKASGYLDLSGTGVAGSLDMTIIPLGIRATAEINIQKADDGMGHTATGVAVSVMCQFPAPIVLGSSGLGIYGFIGLFAMHFGRTNPDAAAWYITVNGDPTDVANKNSQGWVAAVGSWAFGAGLILGTLDGGIILNLKGIIVLELPGPRLLLFMNASLLSPPPGLATSSGGTILATLDLDFGRQTITIGLQIDYSIKPFVEIVIPGRAFFDFIRPDQFSLDLGTIKAPATVKVLDAFNGSGYLMIHGDGIPDFHPPAAGLTGLALAVGISVQLIWGETNIGLYLEVTGSADLGIGFAPFFVAGSLMIEGSLHLFIVSISASGKLDVASNGSQTTIGGSICGSVSFFFFSVSGCVGFTIGGDKQPTVDPLDLMDSVYLQSRSPVLLEGSGTDRPIDTTLLHAPKNQADRAFATTVPIDSIPVLQFAFTPCIDPTFTSDTIPALVPPPTATSTGWVKRGPTFFRYAITNIELIPIQGTPALSGAVPATWRLLSGSQTGDDRGVELALLSWIPFATPSAVIGGSSLDTQIVTTFKNTCTPVADAAAVLWSFSHSAAGPSATGWALNGIAAPDKPGTRRSSPPPLQLKVRELWRSKSALVNGSAMTQAAYVVGRQVPCGPDPSNAVVTTIATLIQDPTAASQFALNSATALNTFQQLHATLKLAPVSHNMGKVLRNIPTQLSEGLNSISKLSILAVSQSPSTGRLCDGRLLIAPFQRNTAPVLFGLGVLTGALGKAAEKFADPIAAQNTDLFDALLFETVQPVRIRLMLWIASEIFRMQGIVVRALDAKGNKLVDLPIDGTTSKFINSPTQAPPEWLENPWVAESFPPDEAALILGVADGKRFIRTGVTVLVDVKLPAKTASFIIGLNQKGLEAAQPYPASYAVAVVESFSASETQRATFDQMTQTNQKKTLAGALKDPAGVPLLAPNGQYRVSVTYTVRTAPVDDTGAMGKQGDVSKPITDNYFFRTDNAAPAVLDPWILTAWPCRDEGFFFWGEPVIVVFASNGLQPLLKAYGVSLVGHSRAASFRNANPGVPGPGKALQVLSPGDIAGFAFTPFEEALRNAAITGVLPCIDASGSTNRHSKQIFDVPLDPLTGYIFDLEESGAPAPPASDTPSVLPPVKPVFRAAFSTSRYATLDEMIADIKGSNVCHRHVNAGGTAGLSSLSVSCTQADMDAALRTAGFGALSPADTPIITVLWEDVPGAKGHAAGVLLDLPEPIRRSRPTPTPALDPNPQNDPARKNRIVSWSLQPQVWLDLVESGTTSSQKIAITTSGTRVYVALKTGLAKGASLTLQVNRKATYPIDAADGLRTLTLLTMTFTNAPWEDA